MRKRLGLILLSLAITAPALAAPPSGTSRGFYKGGTLHGGVAVAEDGPDHYLLFPPRCYVKGPLAAYYPDPGRDPDFRKRNNFYGHPAVVAATLEVAAAVRKAHPEAPRVPIGELSNKHGGEIPFHLSHQNGLDVDIFFMPGDASELSRCAEPPRYERDDPVTGWGVTKDFIPDWHWTLVSTLAARKDVKVIFIGALLEKALGRWAKKKGLPLAERRRTMRKLWPVKCRAPRGVNFGTYKNNGCPHDDHIHVRFHCPKDSPACKRRQK